MAWTRHPLALFLGLALGTGCASRTVPPQTPVGAPQSSAGASNTAGETQPLASLDPVEAQIAKARQHLERGRRLLGVSASEARNEFDQAMAILLPGPQVAAPDTRLDRERQRVIDEVSALEVAALAELADAAGAEFDDLLLVTTFSSEPLGDVAELADGIDLLAPVPIPQNDRVRSAIESLQVRSHDIVAAGLTRAGGYLPMIRRVFREHGLPEALAYLPVVESSYRPRAISRARAQGMWQFMRATAREYGLRQDWYIDERADPEKATVAAAKYLRVLYKMFDGDWHLALAAYNAGPGRIQRAMRRSGAKDYWAMTASSRYLPRETRNYVPLALAAMLIGADPARYGFDVQPDHAERPDRVAVSSAIDLRRIAEWSGATLEDIERLNPELLRWMTPFELANYEVKVPEGTGERLRARLATASPDELISPRWYAVERGDSLWQIARNFNISRFELASANRLSPNARLSIGQRLLVPSGPGGAEPAPTPTVRAARRQPAGQNGQGTVSYRVRAGDTLYEIARLFNTTVAALKQLNSLRSNLIRPGDRLTISTALAP